MNEITNESSTKLSQLDSTLFENLFREYFARLCEYSFGLCRDRDTAIEVVQDVFVTLWKKQTLKDVRSIKAYLFKAVHNNTIKQIQKQNKHVSIEADKEYGYEMPADFELAPALEQALSELPTKCREIFLMSRVEKLRHNEIAQKLNISPRTVEVQIRKASIFLKERLKDYAFLLLLLFFE